MVGLFYYIIVCVVCFLRVLRILFIVRFGVVFGWVCMLVYVVYVVYCAG